MGEKSSQAFYEKQSFPLGRIGPALAIPPCMMLGLLIWQVVLKHPWGRHPMSNANVIGWTIFLWAVFLRLMTVRLVTEVDAKQLIVSLRGFWRSRRIPLSNIQSVELVTYNPVRDYGGYGIRTGAFGKAYVAGSTRGVKLKLAKGAPVIVGSTRPEELARVLSR